MANEEAACLKSLVPAVLFIYIYIFFLIIIIPLFSLFCFPIPFVYCVSRICITGKMESNDTKFLIIKPCAIFYFRFSRR